MTTERTEAGTALTELVMAVFRLNGELLEAAEGMAGPVGLTAARWQVLGPIMQDAKTVSAIGREMGLARQSVQRLAHVLVDEGVVEYLDNPADRRAKLLSLTKEGRSALRRVGERQHKWANATSDGTQASQYRTCVATLTALSARIAKGLQG